LKRYAIIHIHSCFAGASSRDVWLSKEVKEKPNPKDFLPTTGITGDKMEICVDKKRKVTKYYLEDKTFYKLGLATSIFAEYYNTDDFRKLIGEYLFLGFSPDDEFLKRTDKEKYEEDNRKYWENRKGKVIYKQDMESHEYQGGFSDAVFKMPVLQSYLKEMGSPCGFIGHYVRNVRIDKAIERAVLSVCSRSGNSPPDGVKIKALAVWLTSTDGRHFGDSLEGLKFKDQKERIQKRANHIFNLGFIFGLPEHKGTLDSTTELTIKYQSLLL
jgi:hypothetical protein